MNKKIILSVVMIFATQSIFAGEAVLSKEELLTQRKIYEDKLNNLGKDVLDQDALIHLGKKRIYKLVGQAIYEKEQRAIIENSELQIDEAGLRKRYGEEVEKFITSFLDKTNKKNLMLSDGEFFTDIFTADVALSLRINLAKFLFDNMRLQRLATEWEELSNELMGIYSQLEIMN